ncbi:serine/threonine-protein kinase Nek3 isoform X5 [Falco biarmicus]|uniref:serine/threonine-protein kinase Nek3 isoform X5 n=1 Tax=Falco peregrinus TaxID=8954 RepID=UPI000FFB5295|nr:serine/threonine-protein kinase Nek3 isoform X5 [Falco peregrinus]XP_055558478.1 serine/threonine-protein kinase Nek3 isoform X5 [Falco cherrug]XP_056184796.1 serine/threonine-protein kinase Nek3 isoform X5 [Falco biarmicus]
MEEYKVLKILGEGSFGRALLVHHRISDQKYAMKEIRLPMSSSDVENSRKEAVLLAKMKHPNIVAYKESFEAGGHLYIVMEYCDDGDLMQKIKHQRGNLFPEEKILHWFVQMCLGVKHIHDKRVLHRDIKSKNIFLTQNGKVKLGDFGSARLLAHDIWSLGCILYELCTLRHPMFKRNPQNRPSASTILARGSLTKLIKNCLPSEMANEFDQVLKETKKLEGNAARPKGNVMAAGSSNNKKENRRSKDESSKHSPLERKNITKDLSEGIKEQRKSNEKVETSDVLPGITDVSHPHRRQWEKKISNTVVDILENASLLSSSFTSEEAKSGCIINYSENKPRKQWNKETPQTLMDILSNADVSLAFKTYTIYKPASENILKGPLSDETEASDEVDGEHEAIVIDSERLEPRSDDDDTDFEEDDPDWVSELKMILKHSD